MNVEKLKAKRSALDERIKKLETRERDRKQKGALEAIRRAGLLDLGEWELQELLAKVAPAAEGRAPRAESAETAKVTCSAIVSEQQKAEGESSADGDRKRGLFGLRN